MVLTIVISLLRRSGTPPLARRSFCIYNRSRRRGGRVSTGSPQLLPPCVLRLITGCRLIFAMMSVIDLPASVPSRSMAASTATYRRAVRLLMMDRCAASLKAVAGFL
jgi:hypothetical protein